MRPASSSDTPNQGLANGRMHSSHSLNTDLEIYRPGKSVGDRRPFLDVRYQRIDVGLRNAIALHIDLDPQVGEADGFFADVAGAPHCRDVEVALELKLELVDDPSAMHRVGVEPNREARAQRSERGLRGIGGG